MTTAGGHFALYQNRKKIQKLHQKYTSLINDLQKAEAMKQLEDEIVQLEQERESGRKELDIENEEKELKKLEKEVGSMRFKREKYLKDISEHEKIISELKDVPMEYVIIKKSLFDLKSKGDVYFNQKKNIGEVNHNIEERKAEKMRIDELQILLTKKNIQIEALCRNHLESTLNQIQSFINDSKYLF